MSSFKLSIAITNSRDLSPADVTRGPPTREGSLASMFIPQLRLLSRVVGRIPRTWSPVTFFLVWAPPPLSTGENRKYHGIIPMITFCFMARGKLFKVTIRDLENRAFSWRRTEGKIREIWNLRKLWHALADFKGGGSHMQRWEHGLQEPNHPMPNSNQQGLQSYKW